ncbi:MAG: hypothetical protein PHY18_02685 [Dehalococcoidales bacterium]|nr:hypothetical protein [Dehalococcoidales bacterium]
MEYKVVERAAPGREQVEVLGETYEEGKPDSDDLGRWRQKLTGRKERLKYLQTGERYFYGKDWYGSEKRKRPA